MNPVTGLDTGDNCNLGLWNQSGNSVSNLGGVEDETYYDVKDFLIWSHLGRSIQAGLIWSHLGRSTQADLRIPQP
jgi:hypothetical protein